MPITMYPFGGMAVDAAGGDNTRNPFGHLFQASNYAYGTATVTTSSDINISIDPPILGRPQDDVPNDHVLATVWFQVDSIASKQTILGEYSDVGETTLKTILGVSKTSNGDIWGTFGHGTTSEWDNGSDLASAATWVCAQIGHRDNDGNGTIFSSVDGGNRTAEGSTTETVALGPLFSSFNGKLAAIAISRDDRQNAVLASVATGGSGGVGLAPDLIPRLEALFLFNTSTGQMEEVLGNNNVTINTQTNITVNDEQPPFDQPSLTRDIKVSVYGTEISNGGSFASSGDIVVGTPVDIPIKIEADSNNSTLALFVSGFSVTGHAVFDRSSEFTEDSIENGEWTIYRVRLNPGTAGTGKQATVTITSDSDVDSTYSFTLDYDAVDPAASVADAEINMTGAGAVSAPTDPARTKKKASAMWNNDPRCQYILDGQTKFFGVDARAHGGIKQVNFTLEDQSDNTGNTVTVNTWSIQNTGPNGENGGATYLDGFWVEVDVPAGDYLLHAEAIPNDPECLSIATDPANTNKTIFPPLFFTKFSATPEERWVDGDTGSDGNDGAEGSPFENISAAMTDLAATGGIIYLKAGNQYAPNQTTDINNTSAIVVKPASGVTSSSDITWLQEGGNLANWNVQRLQLESLHFDYAVEWTFNGSSGGNISLVNFEWFSSDGQYTVSADGQVNFNSTFRIFPQGGPSVGTERCYFHDCFTGPDMRYSIADRVKRFSRDVTNSKRMKRMYAEDGRSAIYFNGYQAIGIQYSGSAANATVSKTGFNGQNGGTFVLSSTGNPNLTCTLIISGSPGADEALTIAQLLAWVNAQTDWTATDQYTANKPAVVSNQLGAAYVTGEFVSGSGAGTLTASDGVSTDAKANVVEAWLRADSHADYMQVFWENSGVETGYNYMFVNNYYNHETDHAGDPQDSPIQWILVNDFVDGLFDSVFIGNAGVNIKARNAKTGTYQSGQISAPLHNVQFKYNSIPENLYDDLDTTTLLLRWDGVVPNLLSFDDCIFAFNAIADVATQDNLENQKLSRNELYEFYNSQVTDTWSSFSRGVGNEVVVDYNLGADFSPDVDSPLLEMLPAGLVEYPYRPKADYSGYDSFSNDGTDAIGVFGGLSTGPPVITSSATPTAAENQTAVLTVTATDPDGDTAGDGLTFAITGGADQALFSIDPDTGVMTFDAAPDFEDPEDANTDNVYEVTVTVTDSDTETDSQNISVTVTNVDEDPVITSSNTASVAENQTAVLTVTATDAEGDTAGDGLTFSITGGADQALFAIDSNTGVLTFQSAPNYESPADDDTDNVYEVQVTVTDSGMNTAAQSISVTVTDTEEAPSITSSATAEVAEGETAVITVTATDPEGDTAGSGLTFSITGGADASLFSIDADTGELVFDSAPNFEAPADSDLDNVYVVEVTVTDSNSDTDSQTISVTVTDAEEDPVITSSDTVSVVEGNTAVLTVTAVDPEGDTAGSGLTFSITGGADAASFSIDANTGALTFDSAPDYGSPADDDMDNVYVLEVTVTDSNSDTDTQTISVTVIAVDGDQDALILLFA